MNDGIPYLLHDLTVNMYWRWSTCASCGRRISDEEVEDRRVKPCRRRRLPEPFVHVERPYTKANWRRELLFGRGSRYRSALGRIWGDQADAESPWLAYVAATGGPFIDDDEKARPA